MVKYIVIWFLVIPTLGYTQSWMVEHKYEVKEVIPKFHIDKPTIQDTSDLKEEIQVPMVFKAENLPFFCRYEHMLDQQSKVKLRFRLGSLDYVNQLEQK